jgi:transcriptional regulator with XRE-family HTH domain
LRIFGRFGRERGFDRVDVAKALGVPQSYVSNYENGERRLDVLELRRVCRVCKVSLREFGDSLEAALRVTRGD